MIVLILIGVILFLCFGGVLLFGAPYLPTLGPQITAAFELANVKAGQSFLELGCGDGKVLIAAAEAGLVATGYELNPILAFIAWARTRKYGHKVHVVCGNFWTKQWPETDIIFTFLLTKYMKRLDTKIVQTYTKPVRLVSFAFAIPDREADKLKQGVYLYNYKTADLMRLMPTG